MVSLCQNRGQNRAFGGIPEELARVLAEATSDAALSGHQVRDLLEVVSCEAMPYLPKSDLDINEHELELIDRRLADTRASLRDYGVEMYHEALSRASERFHAHRMAYPDHVARVAEAERKAEVIVDNLPRSSHDPNF